MDNVLAAQLFPLMTKSSLVTLCCRYAESEPKTGIAARQCRGKDIAIETGTLNTLLKSLNQSSRPQKLLGHLLHHLVSMLDAQRGFVLLREKARGGLVPVASHSIDDLEEFVSLSSTVYESALEQSRTVVIKDTAQLLPGREALSMALFETPRTIVCTPLATDEEPFGVLYLDMKRREDGIPSSSLEAIELAASIAANRLALYKRDGVSLPPEIELLPYTHWLGKIRR